jgi:hypothetical protein
MNKSFREDMGVKEFTEWVKITLSFEGYTHDNCILVRACEIMKEQEDKIKDMQYLLRNN